MYTPGSFRERELGALHALIRRYNFAVMFSQHDGVPTATHLPFLLDETRGEYGTLIAHIARANPQWKKFDEHTEVLVVFQGPHAYISPSYYADQATVPTWNYAAVHVYGVPVLVHEPVALRPMVDALLDSHETAVHSQWDRSLAEPDMYSDLQAIVGIEIPIRRVEGKWKFNQNRSLDDQKGVVAALEGSGDSLEREVAAIMRENIKRTEREK